MNEINEPHPFCVCEAHKTYCDYGKVTEGCPKRESESFNWTRGQAFRKAAVEYWRKVRPR